jgi:ribosomal-protein-serine acetyltransferase
MPDERSLSHRFVPPLHVEAGWLVCRRVQQDDVQDLYDAVAASTDHLRPWMPWADGYTQEMAQEFVDRNSPRADGEPVTDAPYVARDREGRLLGVCGLHARLGDDSLEIGYWVDVRHTRRGVATVASAALTELAMAVPRLEAVEIHHDQANMVSGSIPAKLGYEHVATLDDTEEAAPGEVGIEWQWRMSRSAWPTSTGARLLAEARSTASAP